MPLPPYFKYIIPGAVITNAGSVFCLLGALNLLLAPMAGIPIDDPNLSRYTFDVVVGIILVCIGVSLLITGFVQRSRGSTYNSNQERYRGHVYRP